MGILIGTLINTQVNAAKGQAVAPDATPLVIPKAVEIGSDFTKLAKKLQPSVVNIVVEVPAPKAAAAARGRARAQDDQGGDDPLGGSATLLRRPRRQPRAQPADYSSGTGEA